MEQDKLAYLENENAKLNKLIGILIEQNDHLKSKIAYLESSLPPQNVYPPYLETSPALQNFISSCLKTSPPSLNVYDGQVSFQTGRINIQTRQVETETGKLNVQTQQVETETGKLNVQAREVETEIGSQNFQGSGGENKVAEKDALPPIPYFVPLSFDNIHRLRLSLGAPFFFRVKEAGRTAMIIILLQAYNKGGCSYGELGKLTFRSPGGMAKLIASLKKRGLVERSGKSSFRLTEKALEYFRKAQFNPEGVHFRGENYK